MPSFIIQKNMQEGMFIAALFEKKNINKPTLYCQLNMVCLFNGILRTNQNKCCVYLMNCTKYCEVKKRKLQNKLMYDPLLKTYIWVCALRGLKRSLPKVQQHLSLGGEIWSKYFFFLHICNFQFLHNEHVISV